jgi:uncharacterized protein (TIGR04255 family)
MPRKATTATTRVTATTRKKYDHDFLAQVIARIDFAEPLAIAKKGPPDKVIASLKKEFPIAELSVKQLKEVALSLSGGPRATTREIREWNYHSKSRNKRAVISSECMFVEFTKYTMFEDLSRDFLGIVDALCTAFKDLQVKRLGLRYVDKIKLDEPNPTKWDDYIDTSLLSTLRFVTDPGTLVRAVNVLEQKFDDESRLRFQFGMPNPDYPALIHQKLFVLDTDASCTLLLSREEIRQFLDTFHERCTDCFERSITSKLRKKMLVKHE